MKAQKCLPYHKGLKSLLAFSFLTTHSTHHSASLPSDTSVAQKIFKSDRPDPIITNQKPPSVSSSGLHSHPPHTKVGPFQFYQLNNSSTTNFKPLNFPQNNIISSHIRVINLIRFLVSIAFVLLDLSTLLTLSSV